MRPVTALLIAVLLVSCATGAESATQGSAASSDASLAPSVTPFPVQTATEVDGNQRWSVPEPHGIGFGLGAVWVSGHHSESAFRIDPSTNELTDELGGAPLQAQDVLVAFESLWVPGTGGPMARMDADGALLATFPNSYSDAEAGFGSVWAVSTENELDRISPESNDVTSSTTVGSGGVDYNNTVAVGESFVWVAVPDDERALAFDPASGDQVAAVDVGGHGQIAAGPAGVWVCLEDGTLLQIDEQSLVTTTSVKTASEGYNLVEVGEDAIWFAGADQTLRKYDTDGAELGQTHLSWPPEGLLIADESAWVEEYGMDRVERIDLGQVAK